MSRSQFASMLRGIFFGRADRAAADKDFCAAVDAFATAFNTLMSDRAEWDLEAARRLPLLWELVISHARYRTQ